MSASPSSPVAPAPRAPLLAAYPHLRAWRVYAFGAVLGLVASLDIVGAILIAMAGPRVQQGLGAGPQEFLWAFSAYAAAAVVANLVLVQLAGRVSYRRFTLASLVVFTAGALGCAAASTLPELALARLVQGLGGGGLFAAARILAQYASQPRERLSLFWGFGLANFTLVALAPWLTAVLVTQHGWPLLFLLQAGLAVALLPLVLWLYPRTEPLPPRPMGRLDWPGVAAFAAGALLLVHALEQLRYATRAQGPVLAAYAVVGLALLAVVMHRFSQHPDPWLNPRRLASRRYLAGLVFYGVFYLVSGAWNYAVPAFMVEGLDYTLAEAGALLSLGGVVTLASVVAFHLALPRLMRKRRYIALGYVGLAASFALMALAARPDASAALVPSAVLLQGAMPVLALLQVAMMTFVEMPTEDFAHAYAFKSIVREIVNALGAGLTVLQLHHGGEAAGAALQGVALRSAAGELLAGLALACLLVAAIAPAQRALK